MAKILKNTNNLKIFKLKTNNHSNFNIYKKKKL